MRRHQRLIAATILFAFSGVLGGCASGGSFDPSDLLDFLDTKKKLPGDRKPVFPEGVPGLEQGVPKELYKGEVEKQQAGEQQQAAQPVQPPPAEEPKAKKGKKTRHTAAAPADQPPQDGEAAAVEEGAAGVPPAPKPKKIARRRTTAPPQDDTTAAQPQQQSGTSGSFPAPMPSGSFSR